ncbi:MAG: hypothetical protein JNL60_09845 [Bacteroidia bacterium]|nr:hypothetical protein [Bacteroidia bacterium]
MKRYFILLFIVAAALVKAQGDSTAFPINSRIDDGIYLTYQDFRHNKPLGKSDIESQEDKSQQEFMSKVLFQEKFNANHNGSSIVVESKKVWGYFQNNTLYVNYQGDFYRVPVFGSICYLVANVVVVNPGFYDPRFGYATGGTSKELREFIMDFYEGVPQEFSMSKVETLIARDSLLFAEYKKLGRRKQKEQIYRYIRKYNGAHPVYFLK